MSGENSIGNYTFEKTTIPAIKYDGSIERATTMITKVERQMYEDAHKDFSEYRKEIPWIAIGLDGTLSVWKNDKRRPYSQEPIGEPITEAVKQVQVWIKPGSRIKILTDRVTSGIWLNPWADPTRIMIRKWFKNHVDYKYGTDLEITATVNYATSRIYDSRAMNPNCEDCEHRGLYE